MKEEHLYVIFQSTRRQVITHKWLRWYTLRTQKWEASSPPGTIKKIMIQVVAFELGIK